MKKIYLIVFLLASELFSITSSTNNFLYSLIKSDVQRLLKIQEYTGLLKDNTFKLLPPVKEGDSIYNKNIFIELWDATAYDSLKLDTLMIGIFENGFIIDTQKVPINNMSSYINLTKGDFDLTISGSSVFKKQHNNLRINLKYKKKNLKLKEVLKSVLIFRGYKDHTVKNLLYPFFIEAMTYKIDAMPDINVTKKIFKNRFYLDLNLPKGSRLLPKELYYKKNNESDYRLINYVKSNENSKEFFVINTDSLQDYEGNVYVKWNFDLSDSLKGLYRINSDTLKKLDTVIWRLPEVIDTLYMDYKRPEFNIEKLERYYNTNLRIKFSIRDKSNRIFNINYRIIISNQIISDTFFVSANASTLDVDTATIIYPNIPLQDFSISLKAYDCYGNFINKDTLIARSELLNGRFLVDNTFKLLPPIKVSNFIERTVSFRSEVLPNTIQTSKIKFNKLTLVDFFNPSNQLSIDLANLPSGSYNFNSFILSNFSGKTIFKIQEDKLEFKIKFSKNPNDLNLKSFIKCIYDIDYTDNNNSVQKLNWEFYIEGMAYDINIKSDIEPVNNIFNNRFYIDPKFGKGAILLPKALYYKTQGSIYQIGNFQRLIDNYREFFVLNSVNNYEGNIYIKWMFDLSDSLKGLYRLKTDTLRKIDTVIWSLPPVEDTIYIDNKPPELLIDTVIRGKSKIIVKGTLRDASNEKYNKLFSLSLKNNYNNQNFTNLIDACLNGIILEQNLDNIPITSSFTIDLEVSDCFGNKTRKTLNIPPYKILCDYDNNYRIDQSDLYTFIYGWRNNKKDISDLYPYEFEEGNYFPYVKRLGDGLIDIRDLTVFASFWSYYKKYQNWQKTNDNIKLKEFLKIDEVLYLSDRYFRFLPDFENKYRIITYGVEIYLPNTIIIDSFKACREGANLKYYDKESNIYYFDYGDLRKPNDYKQMALFKTSFDKFEITDSVIIRVRAYPEELSISENKPIEKIIALKLKSNKKNIPSSYELYQNYPNPFNPLTKIKFDLPEACKVKLSIFDVLGKEIMSLVDKYFEAGSYEVEVDMSSLKSGVYFYKISANKFNKVRKMNFIK